MQLGKFLKNLNSRYKKYYFTGICLHSKNCKKNNVFFALKGKKDNGKKYINDAIKKGAKIIISQNIKEGLRNNILFLNRKHPSKDLSFLSSKLYQKKPKNLIAVTGTNGKSSVADFYLQILKLNKLKCASIGTLGIKSYSLKKTSNTTLDIISINKILNKFSKLKINNVILEASSHGLQQKRLDNINFNTAIFTNLSRDHLDYHKNFKNYLNSKLILFRKLLSKNGTIIFDKQIKEKSLFKSIVKKRKLQSLTIGKSSNLEIKKHTFVKDTQLLSLKFNNKDYSFRTNLIGKIQLKNLLMAVLAASKILKFDNIINVLGKIKPINGRFEQLYKLKDNSRIILDYSHTPDALKTCIKDIKEQFKFSKISIVFGCGGDRDKPKRKIMGKISNRFCDRIYLTDDNPRSENPQNIRKQIKTGITKNKLYEIPSREKAIKTAINNLGSGEVLIVSGKGHENYQEYNIKKKFSDKKIILKFSKEKNKSLSKSLKNNILFEALASNKLKKNLYLKNVSINSNKIKKNQVFFGLKGKIYDGSNFALDAIKNGAKIAVINKNHNRINNKIIQVKNSLKTFSKFSSDIRKITNIKAIAITGSAGKTSLKELSGFALSKIYPTIFSKKSFNNKYGVPLSLSQIDNTHKFGIFEVGMDRKGEINKLTEMIKPDVSIITNVSYAHIKNFKNINGIANAKSEIIDQTVNGGYVILNRDDQFYNLLSNRAKRQKKKIVTIGQHYKSDIRLINRGKIQKYTELNIKIYNRIKKFVINDYLLPYLDNILFTIAIINIFIDISILNKNIFLNFKLPDGRGNKKKIKIKKGFVNVIDESYNSNPLSLSFSIKKFENIRIKKTFKKLILSDMLELGKFSKKLHIDAGRILSKSNVDKVYVYGKKIIHTFNNLNAKKKGKIFKSKQEIKEFIFNEFNNGDYLMIKGSNSTGLNKIVKEMSVKNNAL